MAKPNQDLEPLVDCATLLEAELVRGLLETRGFHAEVLSHDSAWRSTVLGARGATEIRVAVPSAEAAQARSVLAEVEASEDLLEETREVRCPECGSIDIVEENVSNAYVAGLGAVLLLTLYLVLRVLSLFNVLLFVAVLILTAGVLLRGDGWRCNGCHHRWHEAS